MNSDRDGLVPLGFAPFADESHVDQVGVVGLGVLGFLVGYLGSAVIFFDGLATVAPMAPRPPALLAGVFGSIGCWGIFALAFIRGRGGPVLNALVYPIVIVAVVPVVLRWILFGMDIDRVLAGVEFVFFPVDAFVSAGALILPGVVFFGSMLAIWSARLDSDERRAWQREQLSVEFYEAFVAEEER